MTKLDDAAEKWVMDSYELSYKDRLKLSVNYGEDLDSFKAGVTWLAMEIIKKATYITSGHGESDKHIWLSELDDIIK